MVKNGIRATKIPEFEDEADWLEPIAMTIALCAVPLLLILLIAGAFLGSQYALPEVYVNNGTWYGDAENFSAITPYSNPCCDLGYHNSYVRMIFFDENQNLIRNETVTLTQIEYSPFSYGMMFWMFGLGHHPVESKQEQYITDENGEIIAPVDPMREYQIKCRDYAIEAYLTEMDYTIGIPNCEKRDLKGCLN